MKDIAPTAALRKWFAHDPKKWPLFQKKYEGELKGNKGPANQLKKTIEEKKNITFLYAAKDEEHNEAIILKKFFDKE